MKTITGFCVVLAVLEISARASAADLEIAVTVPAEYGTVSYGEDIDITTIQRISEDVVDQQRKCREARELTAVPSDSDDDGEIDWAFNFDFPCTLMTATDHDVCENASATDRDNYFWAPVEVYRDGESALQNLIERAETGEPFGSSTSVDGARQIVAIASHIPNEIHLALCDVVGVGQSYGPPHECVTVAVLTSSQAWLRGDMGSMWCQTMGTYRPSGAIDIEFRVLTKTDASSIVDALNRTLSNDLKLSTRLDIVKTADGAIASARIVATAPLRDSSILEAGWREAFDFDMFISVAPDNIRIAGTAHALVCQQALGQLASYQGLNDAQRGLFTRALDSYVAKAVEQACPAFRQIDDLTIDCGI